MYGSPDLGADFVSLPYANPNAPKGGTLILGEVGGSDLLNPTSSKDAHPGSFGFGRMRH